MNEAARLKKLLEQVRPEARPELANVLRHVAHGMNTPISTLIMEVFSGSILLEKLRSSMELGAKSDGIDALADLQDICANLERASLSLADHVAVLSSFAALQEELDAAIPAASVDTEPPDKAQRR